MAPPKAREIEGLLEFSKLPLFSMPAFLIGNGISRRDYDLNQLKGRGLVAACNFFCDEGYDFSGHPFLLGIQDEEPALKAYNSDFWKNHNIITMDAAAFVLWRSGLRNFLYVGRRGPELNKVGNTGGMLIRILALMGCAPIFILGMGDRAEVVEGDPTNNMHPTRKHKRGVHGYRSYENSWGEAEGIRKMSEQHTRWSRAFFQCYDANKSNIFKVGKSNGYNIPYVEWDDLITTLPVKWGSELREVEGVPIRLPVEL